MSCLLSFDSWQRSQTVTGGLVPRKRLIAKRNAHTVLYAENFHGGFHAVAYVGHLYWVCVVCDVTFLFSGDSRNKKVGGQHKCLSCMVAFRCNED